MNGKFDQLAKVVAQSVTRRQALKRFGGGLVGMALTSVGFDALGSHRNSRVGCRDSGLPCVQHGGFQNHDCNECCGGPPVCHTDQNGDLKCFCP